MLLLPESLQQRDKAALLDRVCSFSVAFAIVYLIDLCRRRIQFVSAIAVPHNLTFRTPRQFEAVKEWVSRIVGVSFA